MIILTALYPISLLFYLFIFAFPALKLKAMTKDGIVAWKFNKFVIVEQVCHAFRSLRRKKRAIRFFWPIQSVIILNRNSFSERSRPLSILFWYPGKFFSREIGIYARSENSDVRCKSWGLIAVCWRVAVVIQILSSLCVWENCVSWLVRLFIVFLVTQYRDQDKELEGRDWLSVHQSVVWSCQVQSEVVVSQKYYCV